MKRLLAVMTLSLLLSTPAYAFNPNANPDPDLPDTSTTSAYTAPSSAFPPSAYYGENANVSQSIDQLQAARDSLADAPASRSRSKALNEINNALNNLENLQSR